MPFLLLFYIGPLFAIWSSRSDSPVLRETVTATMCPSTDPDHGQPRVFGSPFPHIAAPRLAHSDVKVLRWGRDDILWAMEESQRELNEEFCATETLKVLFEVAQAKIVM